MKKKIKFNFSLIPKIAIILYVIFITLFVLDSESFVGFLIHLIPTFIFIATLIFTWKKPKVAGILFILEGIGTIIVFNTYRDLFVMFIISLIPVLIGLGFLLLKNPKH